MATNIARLPSKPARPSIEIDGKQDTVLEAALLSYALSDPIDGMANAELRFGNWGGKDKPGFQYFDRKTLEFGKEIAVKLRDSVLFQGRITAISGHFPEGGSPEISILAEDRLQDLRMVRRTRTFTQSSLAEIAQKIARDHGLQVEATSNGPTYAVIAQVNQSDLAFLYDFARRDDAQMWFEGGKLQLKTKHEHKQAELAWAGTLRAFDVTADLAGQRTKIAASGWDVDKKEAVKSEAEKAAIGSELGNDQAAADILSERFGDRADQVAHGIPANEREARSLAEASYRNMARNFITGHGVCETDPLIRSGAKLKLSGLGPLFDGQYRIRSVTHLFDAAAGSRSEFACDRPGLGRA
ncbi:MAG: phage late control D family protein [Sphingomonadales bacterium]|nr:phage late control D family protein [Sphingomonadales bacterium]